jgi:hypothetical protein
MSVFPEGEGLPTDLPELRLELRSVPPEAWRGVVRRARRRRDRFVAMTATATAAVVAVPAVLLAHSHDTAAVPAHRPATSYDGICDTSYQRPAASATVLDHAIRIGSVVLSPPGDNVPAVPAAEIRRRAVARGARLSPGSQIRYGLVRYLSGGRVAKTELRWIRTACGRPQPRFVAGAGGRTERRAGTQLADDVYLLTDSGAVTTELLGLAFEGACDARLDQRAPGSDRVEAGFRVGEASVTAPTEGDALAGRRQVQRAMTDRGTFPGTQIRLARVAPVHVAGPARLRWVVTTCGLDGSSVRPELRGVVNELLVFDSRGRLVQQERSGPQNDAERSIVTFPDVPYPAPTYVSASPNMCGPWSHAYPDFRKKAFAAGYTDMQGCYQQAETTVIFLSGSRRPAAAAIYRAPSPAAYEATYARRFPWSSFTLVPAPMGSAARLVRLLNPHVAEVELSGAGAATTRYKFDAATLRFLSCDDVTATRAQCGR